MQWQWQWEPVTCTSPSVFESSADVASSRTTTFGALRSARAMPTRWRSPPLSRTPRSPTGVFSPSGSVLARSRSCAARTASSTSASVAGAASPRTEPYRTLVARSVLKSTVSCGRRDGGG